MSHSSRRAFLEASAAALTLGACRPTPSWSDAHDGPPFEANDSGDSAASWSDTAVSTPACAVSIQSAEGPYYRADAPDRSELRTKGEAGTTLVFTGTVRSAEDCGLLADAIVEIWHVQQDAVYDMDSADMHYRTKLRMGFDGAFSITTLKPIAYPLESGKWIAKHFHFRINAIGFKELITQIRFVGDPYDDGMVPPELQVTPTVASDGSESVHYDFALEPE